MDNAAFDAAAELAAVRQRRQVARRKQYRQSKLDRYRAELVQLRQAGASAADLVEWLRSKHRLKIHRSSIDRFLSQLPELAKASVPVAPATPLEILPPDEPVLFAATPPAAASSTPPQRLPLSPFDNRQ